LRRALILAGAASKSYAIEPGDFTNYLRGATQGLPLGAAPPPGVYASFSPNATGLGGNAGLGNQAIPGKVTAPAFGYGAALLFVPGWTFLGAQYEAAVVQGMYLATSESSKTPPFATSSVSSQLANTDFTPIALSWNLTHGWFAAASLHIIGPDGSQWRSTAASVDLNPDYWTFSPAFALSYIDATWLGSANFRYDINTDSRGVTMLNIVPGADGFNSGNELFGDFTWLYKLGKWSFGPVGYFEAQTTADRPGGGFTCATAAAAFGGPVCGFQSQIAVGGLVGYDFGPVALQAWFDETVECKNAVCGLDVWSRLSFKLWGPDSPKPLVAKN
jgi:hypothetical protein